MNIPGNIDLLRQAEAAERTIRILKAKVIDLYNQGAQSTIHKQVENAKRRDDENRRKRELMEIRTNELKRYSETLEQEVAVRTDSMRTILNNVRFGFLVINNELRIQDEYTKTCEEFFGQSRLQGKSLVEVLGLGERQREHYQLGIDQIFEDIMPSEVSLAQLPGRFQIGERILRIEGSALKSGNLVFGILYTISDITALEAAQHEALINRALIGILKQKDAFQGFIAEAKELINASQGLVLRGDQQSLRRTVHTLKGNAASWGLAESAMLIHAIEDEKLITSDHLQTIYSSFQMFLQNHREVIGIDFEEQGNPTFAISRTQINSLKTIIADLSSKEATLLNRWTADALLKPASTLIGPWGEFVAKLAERLQKQVRFEIKGADTAIDVQLMKGSFQNIVHLLRNALDHGIESSDERQGKSEYGKVLINIGKDQENFWFEVVDDGRGINTAKLLSRSIEKKLVKAEDAAQYTRKQQLELIFLDRLSSANETTDISGRGVGMSAILEAVKAVGGIIEITSKEGFGTSIKVIVPIQTSSRLAQLSAA